MQKFPEEGLRNRRMWQRVKRRGLTLAETVIAAMLFTAIALAVMRILPAYFQSLEKQKRRATACFLANRAVDRSLAKLHAHEPAGFTEVINVFSEVGGSNVTVAYNVTVSVGNYTGTHPVDHLAHVTSTVDFDDVSGHQQVKFETLIVQE